MKIIHRRLSRNSPCIAIEFAWISTLKPRSFILPNSKEMVFLVGLLISVDNQWASSVQTMLNVYSEPRSRYVRTPDAPSTFKQWVCWRDSCFIFFLSGMEWNFHFKISKTEVIKKKSLLAVSKFVTTASWKGNCEIEFLCRRTLKKQSWWSWEEKQTQYNTTWSGFWTLNFLAYHNNKRTAVFSFLFSNKILSDESFIEFWSAYLQSVTAGEMDHQTHVETATSAGIGGDERGMERAEKEEAQMTKDGRRR